MSLQNRVDPYGKLRSVPDRGTLTGNRGCLHNAHQKILKPFQVKRWIICLLEFKNRKRDIMKKGHYTELFFLDEATALAAGHRPCVECQRSKFNEFKQAWSMGNGIQIGKIEELDAILHEERINIHKPVVDIDTLPDYAMIEISNSPYLINGDFLYPWSFAGYGHPKAKPSGKVKLITPFSTTLAFSVGYQVT